MFESMSPKKMFALVAAVVLVFGGMIAGGSIWENVDADEIMVVQSPIDGTLTWHTMPGIKWQGFGKVTKYKKRSIYSFNQMQAGKDSETKTCISVRFNDGGHGDICGSVQYDMPLDTTNLNSIHTKFGSQESVQRQLVETITAKSVYMSGPLMSSRESYAEKRTSLLSYMEDQIQHGVYKTTQRDVRVKDSITGQEKNQTIVEIVMGKDGRPERQEEAVLAQFGLKAFNFTITRLPYDSAVEKQIKDQQEITMSVQTAIANAKKAEQDTITTEQQGLANAAKAKWEQEVLKAKAVTEAQQKKEVAALEAEAAALTKKQQILLGEGEATRKKLVMEADGALEKKLDAYVRVSEMYAGAIKDYKGAWVPSVVMGNSSGGQAGSGAQTLVDMLTAKTARELGLNLGVPSGVQGTANPTK